MDKLHYNEMMDNINKLALEGKFNERKIFVFGHCEAAEKLIDELLNKNIKVVGILDNNIHKQGNAYKNIRIFSPDYILNYPDAIICIVARAFASMESQLKSIGFKGEIYKLATYDSFSKYFLSKNTIKEMYERKQRGNILLNKLKRKFPQSFFLFCPFSALGDVYYTMAFLPFFLAKRQIDFKRAVVTVVGESCLQVAKMFSLGNVINLSQNEMDEVIQAALFSQDANVFIPHQDRPYTINISKALSQKKISMIDLYKFGIYGLNVGDNYIYPPKSAYKPYPKLNEIYQNRSAILSPYAKSVPTLPDSVWENISLYFKKRGFQVFTNVTKEEMPIKGTIGVRAKLCEIKSVVEKAGTFIGLRSGLCDVLQDTECKKIALYPKYYYTNTKWTAIEMYSLPGWKNILIAEDFSIDWLNEEIL